MELTDFEREIFKYRKTVKFILCIIVFLIGLSLLFMAAECVMYLGHEGIPYNNE